MLSEESFRWANSRSSADLKGQVSKDAVFTRYEKAGMCCRTRRLEVEVLSLGNEQKLHGRELHMAPTGYP